jgi:hypothetical protein
MISALQRAGRDTPETHFPAFVTSQISASEITCKRGHRPSRCSGSRGGSGPAPAAGLAPPAAAAALQEHGRADRPIVMAYLLISKISRMRRVRTYLRYHHLCSTMDAPIVEPGPRVQTRVHSRRHGCTCFEFGNGDRRPKLGLPLPPHPRDAFLARPSSISADSCFALRGGRIGGRGSGPKPRVWNMWVGVRWDGTDGFLALSGFWGAGPRLWRGDIEAGQV